MGSLEHRSISSRISCFENAIKIIKVLFYIEMKKFALIPTREKLPNSVISSYLKKAGWDPIFLPGYSSIFEAFSKGMELCNIKPEDHVILCHDDIDIVTVPEYFNSLIEKELSNPKTGFIGVAGTRFLQESGVWWEGMGKFPQDSPLNALSGFVAHGNRDSNHINYYGHHGKVVVLDGLFLCKTVPIHIIHASGGEIDGKDSWHLNREAFCEKASDHLPVFIR